MRNLFKYSEAYSGQQPIFYEGDVFRIIVPLAENIQVSFTTTEKTTERTTGNTTGKNMELLKKLSKNEQMILTALLKDPELTQSLLAQKMGLSEDGVRYIMNQLKKKGLLERVGSRRKGQWLVHWN